MTRPPEGWTIYVCPGCDDLAHYSDRYRGWGHAHWRKAANGSDEIGWLEAVPVRVVPAGQTVVLEAVLREARPYVFNRTQGDDWRAETAQELLERVDAALRGSVPAGGSVVPSERGAGDAAQVAKDSSGTRDVAPERDRTASPPQNKGEAR